MTWVNSSSPGGGLVTAVVVKGECATSDGSFAAPLVSAISGQPDGTVEYVGDDSGPHCVTVWGERRPGPPRPGRVDVDRRAAAGVTL